MCYGTGRRRRGPSLLGRKSRAIELRTLTNLSSWGALDLARSSRKRPRERLAFALLALSSCDDYQPSFSYLYPFPSAFLPVRPAKTTSRIRRKASAPAG